jgi:hypothetical protein
MLFSVSTYPRARIRLLDPFSFDISFIPLQGGYMAKRGQHSFLKRQKEIRRKEVAAEKMARRQGKNQKDISTRGDETVTFPDMVDSNKDI